MLLFLTLAHHATNKAAGTLRANQHLQYCEEEGTGSSRYEPESDKLNYYYFSIDWSLKKLFKRVSLIILESYGLFGVSHNNRGLLISETQRN